jgi:hypothetical protein
MVSQCKSGLAPRCLIAIHGWDSRAAIRARASGSPGADNLLASAPRRRPSRGQAPARSPAAAGGGLYILKPDLLSGVLGATRCLHRRHAGARNLQWEGSYACRRLDEAVGHDGQTSIFTLKSKLVRAAHFYSFECARYAQFVLVLRSASVRNRSLSSSPKRWSPSPLFK